MTGGVWVLDGGLLGRLIEGLSHDEKKSSPGSAGVEVPSVGVAVMASVTTTSSGKLGLFQLGNCYVVACNILSGIVSYPPLKLILIFGCNVRCVLRFGILAGKRSCSSVRLKVFGG